MKRFWSYIKHTKSDENNIPPLKSDGLLHEDSTDKANILNQQFKDAFANKDEFTRTEYKQRCNMTGNFETATDINITENGIKKLLLSLNPHKAAGPDDLTPRVLKEMTLYIAPVLTMICKRSYETGIIPSIWKTANVCLVLKKYKKIEAINYRPVSLTCICCKIMVTI